jgi:peptidoglycan-N-acetylglucosamine deacetylase
MIPFRTPFFLPWLAPDLVWRMPTQEKQIFLTFDDGPIPGPTEFVLETLEKHKAKATFFCIGDNVRKYPTIFTQLSKAGHTIGNHTFNHIKGWNHSTNDYLDNIELCKSQFRSTLQTVSASQSLFRPPYGRITKAQIKALKDQYKIIMWDVLTQDYQRSMSQERCLAGSIQATRSGSIVVFHDSLRAEKNLTYALPRYLEHFSNQGFVFTSL